MSFKTANPQVDGEMGQVFYSELAGHLFTARGSDEPGRISDRYFAREAQQRVGRLQARPTGFSAYKRLPAFG